MVGRDGSGRRQRLLQPSGGTPGHDPRVRPDRRGELHVTPYAQAAEVVSVELGDETLVARLSLPPAVEDWETALVVGDTVVRGTITAADDGQVEARYPLVRASWGRPALPLPPAGTPSRCATRSCRTG